MKDVREREAAADALLFALKKQIVDGLCGRECGQPLIAKGLGLPIIETEFCPKKVNLEDPETQTRLQLQLIDILTSPGETLSRGSLSSESRLQLQGAREIIHLH